MTHADVKTYEATDRSYLTASMLVSHCPMLKPTVSTIRCGAWLLRSGVQRLCRGTTPAWTARSRLPAVAPAQTACLATASVSDEQPAPLDTFRVYEQPALYHAAFMCKREFSKEVDFLLDVAVQHMGRQPLSFLELGCGPARHARLLATRGLHGFAVDNSPAMLEYAGRLAQQDGVSMGYVSGDIRQPCLPAGTAVDLAFVLFGTLCHMLTNDDALAMFAAAAASLAPQGIFVVEMTHPGDLLNGMLEHSDVWEVEDPQFGHLLVNYGAEDECDELHCLNQTLDRSIRVTATKHGETEVLSEGVLRQRYYTMQEVDLLGRAAGLRMVGQYGALKLPHMEPNDDEAYALVIVLQKQ